MANLQDTFDRSCRLCAEVQDVSVMIFSAEAEVMDMQNRLNRYLQVQVSKDDKLPKNICIPCCTKLELVCDFIDSIHKAQDNLLDQSRLLEEYPVQKLVGVNIERVAVLPSDSTSYFGNFNEDSNITNMEVSIDPMTILQDSSDGELVIDESVCNADEDMTYIHGIDKENVTIRLLKYGDSCVEYPQIIPMVTAEIVTEGSFEDSPLKPYKCTICNRNFSCDLSLQNHLWSHGEEIVSLVDHKCPSCDQCFEYKNDLIIHLKDHRNLNACTICDRSFKTEVNLMMHMKGHDTPENAYVCKDCGRSYNSRSNLKTHSITHSNIRPYKCVICKKCFKRNQDLKFHMNQHTGNKPYKCPFCDKSFASSGNCYSHRTRMHPTSFVDKSQPDDDSPLILQEENFPAPSPVKSSNKYQCHICEHSFMKRDNYMYHLYQHTGEKPFQCTFCSDNFVTRRGLLLHHDNKHPDKNRPLALISKNMLLK